MAIEFSDPKVMMRLINEGGINMIVRGTVEATTLFARVRVQLSKPLVANSPYSFFYGPEEAAFLIQMFDVGCEEHVLAAACWSTENLDAELAVSLLAMPLGKAAEAIGGDCELVPYGVFDDELLGQRMRTARIIPTRVYTN